MFFLHRNSFPEETHLALLALAGKALLSPGVDGNAVPGSRGVQAAQGAGRDGEVNGKGAAAP